MCDGYDPGISSTSYFEKLTNKDLRIVRENLMNNYGIRIIVNKEKKALMTPGVKGLNVLVGDYILSGVKLAQLEEAKAVSVEYNKMMIERFGKEYEKNLNLVLDNNISEHQRGLEELATVKRNDIKKHRLISYLEYYTEIKKAINEFSKENEMTL